MDEKVAVDLDRLAPGQIISCTDVFDDTFEGELVSYDQPLKLVFLKFPASNGRPNNCDIRIINLLQTKELKIIKEASSSEVQKPLANLSFAKLANRVKNNLEAKIRQVEYLGVGVTPLAQKLLNAISKIITEVRWNNDKIVVMEEVTISPPYMPDNCHGPDGSQALHLVRNLVDKFQKERQQPTTTET